MKKSFFKKSLAVILSIMMLLTAFGGALSVFAEDAAAEETVTDPYGTVESGFNTEKGKLRNTAALETVPDLTFGELGFKYWSSKNDRAGYASDHATLYTDASYGYAIGLNVDGNQYDGIETIQFKIPGAKVGDQYYVRYDYKINAKLADTTYVDAAGTAQPLQMEIHQMAHDETIKDGDVSLKTSSFTVDVFSTKAGQWNSYGTGAVTVASENSTFSIVLESMIPSDKEAVYDEEGNLTSEAVTKRAELKTLLGGEPVIYISNIRVCTYDGEVYTDIRTGEKLYRNNQPQGGSAEEGVRAGLIESVHRYIENTDGGTQQLAYYKPYSVGPQNLDFTDGLKYWSIRYKNTPDFRDYDTPGDIYDVIDGVAKFTGVTATVNTYLGLVSVPFTMDSLKAGDQVVLKVDSRNATSGNFKLKEIGGSNVSGSLNTSSTWTAKNTTVLTITNDNPSLYIVSENSIAANATNGGAGAELDNFQLLKVLDNGLYLDLVSGKTVYVTGEERGGSVENGLTSDSNNAYQNLDALDAPVDFTFTNGFEYWTSKHDRSGYASDYGKLVTDETGDYAYAIKAGGANYDGITTIKFKLPTETQVAFIYSYKLDASLTDTFSNTLGTAPLGINIMDMSNNSMVTSDALTRATTYGSWSSSISGYFTPVADTYYSIRIQLAKDPDDTLALVKEGVNPVLIKDIRVVQVLDNNIYKDIATGELYYKDNQPVGGTAEDGVVPGYYYNDSIWVGKDGELKTDHYGANEGLVNGDFTEGLKYWALKADKRGSLLADGTTAMYKASDIATVTGNYVTIKATAEGNSYNGLQTATFTLKNSGIKANEKIYLNFDANTTGTATVWLNSTSGSVSKAANNKGVWENHTTAALTVGSLDDIYVIKFQANDNVGGTMLGNFNLLRDDRGGLVDENGAVIKKVELDGTLLDGDLYGDANADGKVDLIDLVRMKKYMVNEEGTTPIFLAASDIAVNDVIDATDLGYVIDHIIGKTEITGRVEA